MSTTLAPPQVPANGRDGARPDRYKWIALSNTTIGMLITTINSSIVLIALPDIFRGIHLDPLQPGNTSYLLWMMMGFMVATAVLVVTFGRIGDMFGRVKMFNLGLAVFTVCLDPALGDLDERFGAALWLIAMRILQGVGGALVMGNSSAILTDAFPSQERGLALGVNAVAAIAGSFMASCSAGCSRRCRGGSCSSSPCRSASSARSGRTGSCRSAASAGRPGSTGGATRRSRSGSSSCSSRSPTASSPTAGTRWAGRTRSSSPRWSAGLLLLALFVVIELRQDDPMFSLGLFRIRAFTAGSIATLLASLGRGGLMFMLIIWLQGIWLPLHGYSFSETPLWAGIYMLPLTVGFLIAGPDLGQALGPLRRAPVRDRRHARRRRSRSCCSSCCRSTSTTGRSPRCCCSWASRWASSPRPTRWGS